MKKKLTLMFVALIAVAAFATTQMLTSRRAATAITIGETELTAANNDVFKALKTAKDAVVEAGGEVGDITINLAAKGSYTLSGVLEAPANLTINGKGATIDASTEGADNIIGIKGVTAIAPKADGDPSTYAYVSAITIKDVTISGMKKALIRDYMENKTYLQTLTIDNCVIQASTTKVVVDFDSRGFVGNVVVKNSTIWAAAGTGKHFVKYGSRPNDFNNTLLQAFDVQNSTFVNIASNADFSGGTNFNNFKQMGTANNSYTLKNNIFVNCGKNGQTVVGFNSGQINATPAWDVDGNAFNWNGEDTSATEVSKAGKKNEVDIVQNSVVGVVVFEGAATGNFTLGTECAQYAAKIGDPRWIKYAVNVADGITNGTVKVDKATAAEGEEVTITTTPADGYMLDAISVKGVTSDLAVTVKDGKFTMPADAVTVSATFKVAPVDVTVEASDITGGEITSAIAAKAAGKPIKNITINLAANGAYTVIAPIEANQGVIINGNGAKIDASSLAAPFIKMNPTPIFDAVESGQFVIKDPIKIEGVTISGLDNSLISDGGAAYAFDNFTILDCVIELLQTQAFSFDFSKSMPINFNITNSTIYSKTATSSKNFMSISGKRPDQITGYTGGAFKFENNTFVNCGTTKQFINTNTIKGKGNVKYTWTKNIFVDCGNKQIWDKLDNGNAPKDCSMNTYWFAGANAGEKYDTNVLTTDPGITAENIAAGKFTIGAASLQALYKTGDPRWLVDFAASQNVTTAASGYTTLVSVYPLDFTTAADLTAYVVAADEDIDIANSKVKLTQVTEAAANTPVILLGTASTDYTITVKADAAAVTGNLLKGSATTAKTLTDGEAYLLKDGKFGLCKAGELPAGKAYLPTPGSASNELIIVIDGEVTGIDKVVTRDALENAKIYNLQGQEVKKAGKGIYIINGKKVVMK
jgi:hypothetical protein